VLKWKTKSFEVPFAEDFRILHCPRCDLAFTDPIPSRDTVRCLYEQRETSQFQGGEPGLVRRLKRLMTARQLKGVRGKLGLGGRDLTILDFGCGDGAFSAACLEVFPTSLVLASDFGPGPPPGLWHVNSPRLSYVSFDDLHQGRRRYDLIICRHVLEHVHAPRELVTMLGDLLAPGGAVWVEVPSVDTIWLRLFGGYWHALYAPFHIFHFSPASLERLLTLSGFKRVVVARSHSPQVGRSLNNLLGWRYNLLLFSIGVGLYPLEVLLDKLFRRSSCLTAYCWKDA
jgi:SAM-dependent methyltransferase